MIAKTRKNKKRHAKPAKKVLEVENNSDSVWGKNKPLEKFWQGLADGKYVVLIYKDGKSKKVSLPTSGTQRAKTIYDEFDANEDIRAVLSSNMSQDAYEVFLYPKAKDKSVEYVIKNYKKFFTWMNPSGNAIGEGVPVMKKVMVP